MSDFWIGLGLFLAGGMVGASIGALIMAGLNLSRRNDD